MNEVIQIEKADHVAVVKLNRPESLNALSRELRQAITDTFTDLRNDDETRVIILTGNGRAFCAGLDLKELGRHGLDSGHNKKGDLHNAIRSVGKPIIGAINGHAITGGFEIALMCDILIGSTNARFADTHVRMGVVPGWGLSQRLAGLIGSSRAKELSFSGNYLDASDAERWGLINRVVSPDELLSHCLSLARDICSVNANTLKAVHELIDFGCEHSLAEGLQEEKRVNAGQDGALPPQTLDKRRETVMKRGRGQNR